ncbi:ABC transporter ATP-binding protein [bacterium]|nr:ABC transporter ATP-binding protein [bacterium]
MIKLRDITKAYKEKVIFDHFNLDIEDHKITCILGASGVGKTTLMNIIANMTKFQGHVDREEKISYIFQEPRLIPTLTVKNNLKFTSPDATEEQMDQILDQLNIRDKRDTFPNQLSGGEAQRVSIARAFLYDASIILMDEPFSSLDLSLKYKLIQQFSSLWKMHQRTVVFVTHNIDEALLLSDEILILKEGRISKKYQIDAPLPRGISDQEELRKQIISDLLEED